ncbi:MAG: hypothetical protein GY877_10835 [Hyphomicrobium sp.]|nr:hypothetical protein [Hyphomicrobium sp.]
MEGSGPALLSDVAIFLIVIFAIPIALFSSLLRIDMEHARDMEERRRQKNNDQCNQAPDMAGASNQGSKDDDQ